MLWNRKLVFGARATILHQSFAFRRAPVVIERSGVECNTIAPAATSPAWRIRYWYD
ncbi:hypothetical protein PC119_g1120 [Phytophthora cactorum]|nr:hypothetical protein PC119_g1120 [Phytophthora cactorum]